MPDHFNDNAPETIRVPENKFSLILKWAGEGEIEIYASTLRDHCRSAGAISMAVKGLAVPANDDLTITGIELVGSYALNIAFSDGHDRGIYPWKLLRTLAMGAEQKAHA